MVNILEHYTWPTQHLKSIKRGIPQGNNISSFIGNIYLLPLDQAFKEFSKKYKSYLKNERNFKGNTFKYTGCQDKH